MKIRILAIVIVVLLGVAAASTHISQVQEREAVYRSALEKAQVNKDKGLPYNAYNYYLKAFEIRCEDEQIYIDFLSQAEQLGGDFYVSAVESYVEYFPASERAYELLCKMLYEQGSYKTLIKTALEAREKGAASEQVRLWYLECSHMLKTVKGGLAGVQSFLGGYARVELNGLYGYISQSGKMILAPTYEKASPLANGTAAVFDGKEWAMINIAGFKVAKTDVPVSSLSMIMNNKISVSKDGKYGYMGADMVLPDQLPYDYASTYRSGIAAVQKDGAWGLVDENGTCFTGFIFEDILLDEFDTCIANGVVFAKTGGKYYMYDAQGARISQQGFDDACPFVDKQPAAVCIDGKWGFSDGTGKLVIQPKYEGAKSFNLNLGAVCVDGVWGYISTNEEIRIECQFEDCLPFASNGIAAVKENGVWKYVQLLPYNQ